MNFKSILYAFAAALAIVSCKKDNTTPSGDATLELSQETIQFSKEADEKGKVVNLTSNSHWDIKDADKIPFWLSVNQKSGEGNATIIIRVTENKGKTKRSCDIKFYVNKATTATLTVTQDFDHENAGDGSYENPYSASEALAVAQSLSADAKQNAYVKGIISSITKVDTSYGNAEYSISDDGITKTEFLIYRGYYFNGDKFTSADQIKVGDSVVILGDIVNYNGTKPEMTTGSKIIKLNGKEPTPPSPITGENLLSNSGFELWNDDSTPTEWKEVSSNATVEKESTEKHSGEFSAKITGASDSNKRLMSKVYKLKAGTYQLDAYTKGEGQFRIGWAKVGDDGKVASGDDYYYLTNAAVAGADWTKSSGQFTLTEVTRVSIVIMNAKAGSGVPFYADDIALVTENGGIEGGDDPVSAIRLASTSLNFSATSDTKTVELTSTVAWTATGAPDWITVSPASGLASATVSIVAKANEGAARTATITFVGTDVKDRAVLTLKQAGASQPTTGDGTLNNPYTASDAISVASALADGEKVNAYVKGIISSITKVDTSYGNAEYSISDDGITKTEFLIYRGYYLNGAKFTSKDQIKVGDSVVVLGDIINYNGNTPEITSGSKIISINGETPEPPTPVTGEFASTIEWTSHTDKASYDGIATVNGTENVPVLKLGKSGNSGQAELKVKAGTSQISFYAVSWNGKSATLSIEGIEETVTPIANAGANNNSPYTLTVSSSDFYTLSFVSTIPNDTYVTISTDKERVIVFAINAVEK